MFITNHEAGLKKLFWKLELLLRAIFVLTNWYMYIVVYFRLTKKPEVILKTRNGFSLKIRTNVKSTDIHVFTEIWLEKEYSPPPI